MSLGPRQGQPIGDLLLSEPEAVWPLAAATPEQPDPAQEALWELCKRFDARPMRAACVVCGKHAVRIGLCGGLETARPLCQSCETPAEAEGGSRLYFRTYLEALGLVGISFGARKADFRRLIDLLCACKGMRPLPDWSTRPTW